MSGKPEKRPKTYHLFMTIMKTLLLILCIFNSALAGAVTIDATLNRNTISINDSVQLTFTAPGSPDGDPDFEPLSQDFEIINQNHSSQSSWINGQSSEKIEWIVQLLPKHAGTIVIPSIAFGSDKSAPITLEVTQTAPVQIDTDAELFLKVEADSTDPYVQAQVLYTLRFYRRVNIAQARLDEPSTSDALVQKIGEDISYNTELNGLQYAVTERKYAIFPQKSGSLIIAPVALTAEVVSGRQPGFNGFFNSPITHTRRVTSNAITLNVRPAPPEAQSKHWLPAQELEIKQEWSGDFSRMQVGEPLTRTLIIIAKGTTVGVLPELNSNIADPSLKNYPDQPIIKELQKPEGIYAMREEKIALIASKAGVYHLPAIEVPWFNTGTQHMQIASIPAVTLTVAAGANASSIPVPPVASAVNTGPNSPQTTQLNTAISPAGDQNVWLWVAVFLGIGWLSTLIYFLTTRHPKKIQPATDKAPPKSDYHQALKQACQKNDPQMAKQALLQWGYLTYQVNSLGALAELCDSRLRDEIQHLNQLLYAPAATGNSPWQGKRLYQVFTEQAVTQKLQRTPDEALEPLFRI